MSYKKIILIVTFLTIIGFLFNFNLSIAKAITAAELQTRIAKIQAQIARLQQQLAEIQGKVPPEVQKEVSPWCYNFYRNLGYGDRGDDIKALQIALQKEGIYKGPVTSYFGSLTLTAVMSFQVKYAEDILGPWGLIKGTGFVGGTTRVKLNKLYGCGEIVEKFITVSSPNGGEKYEQGIVELITWKSNKVERVKIDLLDYSSKEPKYITIYCIENPGEATIYAPSGICHWFVPTNILGDKYKISIKDASDPGKVDESDSYFSIIPKLERSITVIFPNGEEEWRMGNTYRIRWEGKGFTEEYDVYIFIFAYDANKNRIYYLGQPKNIAEYIPATQGYYDWRIPSNFDEEFETIPTYYKLFIRVVKGLGEIQFLDSSDGYFRIVFPIGKEKEIPFVTITSPNGGEKWIIGNTYNITWNSAGVENVNIEIERGKTEENPLYKKVVSFFPASGGKYSWTIPTDINPGDNSFKIRIWEGAVEDRSNDYFSIGI